MARSRLAVALMLAALAGCSWKPEAISGTRPYLGDGAHAIFVVNHGWHTGLVIRSEIMLARVPALTARFAGSRFLEFGWGDRAFYQAEQVGSGLALRAVVWPTESVMHVVGIDGLPGAIFSDSAVRRLCVNAEQQAALATFIDQSFARDARGEVSLLGAGLYGRSHFYAGVGGYHLFNTCNSWTAKGLRSLGMTISPPTMPTAQGVMDFLAGQANGQADCPDRAGMR